MPHARAVLSACQGYDISRPLILLVSAQKGALSAAEVCEALGMSQLKGRKWHVQSAVAIRGEGLYEGLDWCAPSFRCV